MSDNPPHPISETLANDVGRDLLRRIGVELRALLGTEAHARLNIRWDETGLPPGVSRHLRAIAEGETEVAEMDIPIAEAPCDFEDDHLIIRLTQPDGRQDCAEKLANYFVAYMLDKRDQLLMARPDGGQLHTSLHPAAMLINIVTSTKGGRVIAQLPYSMINLRPGDKVL